jgi:ABC-type lipoprotein release transport system permease subunit
MSAAEAVRRKIHEIEPSRSVFEVSPLTQHLSDNFAENRLRATLLTFFAVTAVLLACIGLYGTLTYFVSIRRREVGLRLALGALRGQIVTRFLFHGLRATLVGCVAGVCLAAAFVRMLANMLFGISSWDAATFVAVLILVLVTSTVASLFPAVRAARVEPMQVLREE